MKTFEQLKQQAVAIRDAVNKNENSAERVGAHLLDTVEKMESLEITDVAEAVLEAEAAAAEAKKQADIASQSGEIAQKAKEQGDIAEQKGNEADAAAQRANEAADQVTNKVLFKIPQDLSEEEQAQVKRNIGLQNAIAGLITLPITDFSAKVNATTATKTVDNIIPSGISFLIVDIGVVEGDSSTPTSPELSAVLCPVSGGGRIVFQGTASTKFENFKISVISGSAEKNGMGVEVSTPRSITYKVFQVRYLTEADSASFKGSFNSSGILQSAYPTARPGDYAYVGNPRHLYEWDSSAWQDRGLYITDVDQALDIDSGKAIANKAVTAKLSKLDEQNITTNLEIKPYIFQQDIESGNGLYRIVKVGHISVKFKVNVTVLSGGAGVTGYTVFAGTIEKPNANNIAGSSFGGVKTVESMPEGTDTLLFFTQKFSEKTILECSLVLDENLTDNLEKNNIELSQTIQEQQLQKKQIETLENTITQNGLNGVSKQELCKDNGIIAMWTEKIDEGKEDSPTPCINNMRNTIDRFGVIFQIANKSNPGDAYFTYSISDPKERKTGIETIELTPNKDMGRKVWVKLNWDAVPESSPFISASNRPDIEFNNMNGGEPTGLKESLDNLHTELNATNKKINEGFEKTDGEIKKLEESLQTIAAKGISYTPVNVFGDVLPKKIIKKLRESTEDIEIGLVGNSVTGLVENCDKLSEEDAQHSAPGMTYKHWSYLLWESISKNRPIFDRFDSKRDGSPVFTSTGTFNPVRGLVGQLVQPDWSGEYSTTADTFSSTDINASVQFDLNLSQYKKATIIFAMSGKSDATTTHIGCDTEISVDLGNGYLLASLDRTDWREANGFSVSQNCNPNDYTESQCKYSKGVTLHQRHRRIWLKAVEGKTDNIKVTYQRKSSDVDPNHEMYFHGVERWNQQAIFVTNLGRNGRPVEMLTYNSSDIFDRKLDLVIFELPLANETNKSQYSLETLKERYRSYFFADAENSFKTKSENFETTSLLIVLPHGRAQYFSGNNLADYNLSVGTKNDMFNYLKCKAIYQYLKDNLQNDNVSFINMMDTINNEAITVGKTIEQWLDGSDDDTTMTQDKIHLNNLGSRIWHKYLYAIFTT